MLSPRHNTNDMIVCKAELAILGEFSVEDKWWLHDLPSLLESSMKILWDFTIQTDRCLSHNRPDIVCINHHQKTAFIIDIAIPGESRFTQKINEKCKRYTDLKIETQKRGMYVYHL